MTDQQLEAIIATEEHSIMLNAVLPGHDNSYVCNTLDRTMPISRINNKLLTPVFNAHKVNVTGYALIFNDTMTLNMLMKKYKDIQTGDIFLNVMPDKVLDYKITTCFVNSIEGQLTIPGFTLVEDKRIDACFTQARYNARQAGILIPIEEEFIISKFYISDDNTEIIRIVNYHVPNRPSRTSEFNLISGSSFSSPEAHILLAMLPVFFTELKELLSQEELELFRVLAEPFNLNTLAAKNRLRAVYNTSIYLDRVKKIEQERIITTFKQRRVSNINNRIDSLQQSIMRVVRDLDSYEVQLNELNMEKQLITYQVEGADTQLLYVLEHPYVFNFNLVSNNVIKLMVRVPLTLWDPEHASMFRKNLTRIVHENTNKSYYKYIECFFDKVLIDQVATYYMQNIITIDTEDLSTGFENRIEVHNSEHVERMVALQAGYNPHLAHYGCVGTHQAAINKARNSKDITLLLEAMLNPIKNWNLTDGAVMTQSMRNMFPILINNNKIKCIEYDNKMYSMTEFYNLFNEAVEEEFNNEGDEDDE